MAAVATRRAQRLLTFALGLALMAAILPVASARADALIADVTQPGVVNLIYRAPLGTRVQFVERVGDRVKLLGNATVVVPPAAVLLQAARWRCDRPVRSFESTAILPDGTRVHDAYAVHTDSCASRFAVAAPRRLARGATARVRITDTWRSGGVRPRLCVTPPHERRSCRVVALVPGVNIAVRRLDLRTRGLWRLQLRYDGFRTRAAIAVGHAPEAAPLPTVLATGDSTIQGVDGFLGDQLSHVATVRSDVYPGSGVSRGTDWLSRSTHQARHVRPRITVVSLGSADGLDMRTPVGASVTCCSDAWRSEYTRRVRLMMKTYIHHGRGRVLWLAVPLPRNPLAAIITTFVNDSVVRAADGLPGAMALRLDLLFTPTGYRDEMLYHGRVVRVRASDGDHLSLAGTAIAAEAIAKALRSAPDWLDAAPV